MNSVIIWIILPVGFVGILFLFALLMARIECDNSFSKEKKEYFSKCLSEMIETDGGEKKHEHILYTPKQRNVVDYVDSWTYALHGYMRFLYGKFEGAIKLSDCVSITVSPYYKKKTESCYTPPKEKSVVGSAVVGGLLAGGAGAVVGAVSAADKNARQTGTTSYRTTTDKSVQYGRICIRFRNTLFNNKIMDWNISTDTSYEKVCLEIKKLKDKYNIY